ncbi:Predicted ATP-binding protein involved in virulence [Yersinia nurmii]|uniref:Predicted ATP-binding protein involved in virulence n=1 Tax=Yersinia nurmii TaxID=685706 RepID=A0ABP1YMG7_9GAMM|nr:MULTISPECIES: AAA family ATPase [Yersinia]CNF29397.1 Predicted ATP-binding protein involved in virulence [Yersinia nurmii]
MELAKIKIKNIKNIRNAEIDLPIEGGVYSLVGGNGCGKSTIMLLFSVIMSSKRYYMLQPEDFDSSSTVDIQIHAGNEIKENNWSVSQNNKWVCKNETIHFPGVYEGSLFYGSRFDDSRIVDNLTRDKSINGQHIVDAFDYVKENLSFILHGDREHYKNMKRIKNKKTSEMFNLKNVPYFMETPKGHLLSQYRMSSGECLLVSLLNYIYCSIVNSNRGNGVRKIAPVFIDEIELALHPIAISRLIDYLNELVCSFPKVCVYLTSHSPEVIRSLKPENMFMINNLDGNVSVVNPCYPSYAIREVYRHDGFDYLILAEDKLAEKIIDSVLLDANLKNSRLIHISPVGGWNNVLSLHLNLLKNNVMGVNKKIISILDGDVISEVALVKDFKNLPKIFLPIPSIEKFIYAVAVENKYSDFRKVFNDKYFPIKSLDDFVAEHNKQFKTPPSNPDKKFYFRIKKDLESRSIDESYFISNLTDDIKRVISFDKFKAALSAQLTK